MYLLCMSAKIQPVRVQLQTSLSVLETLMTAVSGVCVTDNGHPAGTPA